MHVLLLLGMPTTLLLILVIGPVTADTTNQEIVVSATTQQRVVPDNISQEIAVTPVILHHQMPTTQALEHVIGVVALDILDQVIHVSVTRHTVV